MEGSGPGHTHRVEPGLPKLPGPGQAGLQGKGRASPSSANQPVTLFPPLCY